MKIAISTSGKEMSAPMDDRFGRAKGFIIYDTETGSHEFIDNKQNLEAAQGAGIQSAKRVIDAGVSALITGNVGPKAYSALSAAGVEMFLKQGGTVEEAVKAYTSGSLEKTSGANVESHW